MCCNLRVGYIQHMYMYIVYRIRFHLTINNLVTQVVQPQACRVYCNPLTEVDSSGNFMFVSFSLHDL